jgi:hypothetical protein
MNTETTTVAVALENCVDVSIDNHCEEDYDCTHVAMLVMEDGSTRTCPDLCWRSLLPVYERLHKADSKDYKHLLASCGCSSDDDANMATELFGLRFWGHPTKISCPDAGVTSYPKRRPPPEDALAKK